MSDRTPENFQKHCPGCFRRKDNHSVCPHCGYDEASPRSPLFLPHGAVLAGQYRVGKVLGRPGGFGITYLGWDIYLQQKVAIKEYLPPDIAARIPESQDITVHTQDDRKSFETGKEQFLREARIVARLDHPNVVRVRGFFNANDTAYMVMDYYDGMSLDAYFGQVKPVIEPVIASSLMQLVLDGLDYVHRHGVVHRDMKPHNIYIAAVGKPIILDFGAARQAITGSNKSVSVVLTEGYAPLEQYQRHGTQGPWTDVYGVAATLYRMITGQAPPVAIDRIHRDQLEVDNFAGLPDALKPVMRKALTIKAEERYQTAGAFKLALAIALGPASANAPMPAVSTNVRDMSLAPPSPHPLPSELLRDTTSRSSKLPAALEQAITRPGPFDIPPSPAAPQAAELSAAALPTPVTAMIAASAAAASPASPPPPASYRTTTPTAPTGPKAPRRWAMPAAALASAAVIGFYLLNSKSPPPAATAPASPVATPAPASSAATDRTSERFDLDGLPPLPATALPELAEVPAGVRDEVDYPALRMSRSEITVSQFRAFAERARYSNPAWDSSSCEGADASARWDNPGYAQTESHPVVCVNWDDARRYAQWLSQETGRKFRLPSDREWEYAAAAGSTTPYWWGNALTESNAVCADCGRINPTRAWIVATLGQNAWGLYGSASNVREWTCSALAQGNCAAAELGGERVTRGGSWHDPATALQTSFRDLLDKQRRNTWTGFRVMEEL